MFCFHSFLKSNNNKRGRIHKSFFPSPPFFFKKNIAIVGVLLEEYERMKGRIIEGKKREGYSFVLFLFLLGWVDISCY
jgi:hypothetical protein